MAKLIPRPLSPPTPELAGFVASLNENLRSIANDAHDHAGRTSAPGERDGVPGDMRVVVTETETYLAVRTASGWFRTAALTPL